MGRTPMGHRSVDPPSADDERRLVEGLLAGSHDAVSEFLDRTHHAVFCMACRLTADPERRRDWAHTVLIQILEDLEQGRFVYRRPGGFWAWFRKRAYYRLLDEYRRHRRQNARETEADAPDETGLVRELAGGEDPAVEAERVELLSAVEACLGKLANRDQRRAVQLLVLDDMSYDDIARIMSAPLNTIRAWIRRGRLALRKCLAATLGNAVGEASDV